MGFFSALTGKDSVNTLEKANKQAMGYLSTGRRQAVGNINTGYDSADSLISPYLKSGQRGYEAYADSIGLNGLEGYGRARTMFDTDPFTSGEQEATNLAVRNAMRNYNAGGMANSGLAALGSARIGAERYGQRVSDFRNRLAGAGQQGLGTAQYAGGLKTDRGNALANLNYGYGQQAAGNTISMGNAKAQIQAAGANNMLNALTGVAGLGLQAFAPSPGGGSAAGNFFSMFK